MGTKTLKPPAATRRSFLASSAAVGAVAAASTLAAPAILRAQDEPIRIGALLPFSGGLELFGEQGIMGIEMAVREANAVGGVLGRRVEVIRADNATDPRTTVERATQLVQRDGVLCGIGPITSAARDAVRPTMERLRTPLLYATDYEGGVCSDWMACYSALPDHYVDPLLPYLTQNFGDAFYLFGADHVWPQKMNEAITRVAGDLGASVVGEEYTPWGARDFASAIRNIDGSGATVLISTLPGADGITFLKQVHSYGLKDRLKVVLMGLNENYLSGFTTEEVEGIMGCAHFIQTLDRPETLDFVGRAKALFGDDAVISYYLDSHYGITRFFLAAIERAGSVEKAAIMAAIGDQDLVVGNGSVHMRADDRHVDLNMLIHEARGGRLELVDYLGRVEAAGQCAA